MNVIHAYLDTMFSKYPSTSKMKEAKDELREMMEDAYQAALAAGKSENEAVGQVITEFGNLDELAPVLGISSEVGLGVSAEASVQGAASAPPQHPPITLDEAQGFTAAYRANQLMLSIAVALCVISPATLVSLTLLSDNPRFPIPETMGIFIGLSVLFVFVLVAVSLFIVRHQRLAVYERILEGQFSQDPAVTAWTEQLKREDRQGPSGLLVIAIALWILAALPLIGSALFDEYFPVWGDQLVGIGLPITLVMIALGLLLWLPTEWRASVVEYLEVPKVKEIEESYPMAIQILQRLLWPVTLIVFLTWSFLGEAWAISWIVWVIAGAVHWALSEVGAALARK